MPAVEPPMLRMTAEGRLRSFGENGSLYSHAPKLHNLRMAPVADEQMLGKPTGLGRGNRLQSCCVEM